MPFSDLIVQNEPGDGTNNIITYAELGKCTFEQFKKRIHDQGVTQIPKLRAKHFSIIGFNLWQEVDASVAMKQVTLCDEKIRDEESLTKYCEKHIARKLDRNSCPWEIHFIEEFEKDTCVMVMLIQHSVCDATGYVSLMSALLDNQFKLTLKKHIEPPKWYLCPIYFFMAFFYFGHLTGKYAKIHSDKDTARCRDENGLKTFTKHLKISKEIDFNKVKKAYKSYGADTTFGAYFMGATSVGLKKWYDEYEFKEANTAKVAISVNRRDLPTSYEDMLFCNYVTVFQFEFPILSSMKEAIVQTNKALFTIYSDFGGRLAEIFMYYTCFFPKKAIANNMEQMLEGVDLGISNIQFAEEEWVFLGKKVQRRALWASAREQMKIFFLPITYEDKLRVQLVTNKAMQMDSEKLLAHIVKVIEDDVKQF
jgi:hypothetical protein